MPESNSDKPVCAHYLSRYLKRQENWIFTIVSHHREYKPVVLTRARENLSLFPAERIFSLDELGSLRRNAEILFSKIFGYFPFMEKACRRSEVRILHVHFGNHGLKMIGLSKELDVPLICSFYGVDAFAQPDRLTARYERLFSEADRILALGPYMKAALVGLGCPEEKIRIHHLGIDVDRVRFVRRSVVKGGKVRFLVVSSFVEKKGIDLAIGALAAFRDRYSYTLDIIGDGPLKEKILEVIEASGIGERITLHGYQSYDYFIDLAYKCDVLIQASRTAANNDKEGTPMSIVDAMATGMAVVSTRHSDIPEIVADGEQGYLANESDVESLRDCIGKILEVPDQIGELGSSGRKKVEEQFDAAKQAVKLEYYYSELLTQRRRR